MVLQHRLLVKNHELSTLTVYWIFGSVCVCVSFTLCDYCGVSQKHVYGPPKYIVPPGPYIAGLC